VIKLPSIEKLVTFFGKLSKREKLLFYGAAITIAIMGSDRLFIRPLVRTFQTFGRDFQSTEVNIKTSVRLLSQKERITEEINRYAPFAVQAASQEEETSGLLKFIEELAHESDLELLYVKPAAIKTQGRVKKYYVTLECQGLIGQVMVFFHSVENAPQPLKIEKYTIQPAAKGSATLKFGATISKGIVT